MSLMSYTSFLFCKVVFDDTDGVHNPNYCKVYDIIDYSEPRSLSLSVIVEISSLFAIESESMKYHHHSFVVATFHHPLRNLLAQDVQYEIFLEEESTKDRMDSYGTDSTKVQVAELLLLRLLHLPAMIKKQQTISVCYV